MPATTVSPDLFPPLEPFRSGRLKVDDLHEIYWEECGNPNGAPVVFLHGGPGAGASPTHRRFFDPAVYRIIIFDQRGAGRSTPLGETRQNTTELLIADMEMLRQQRGIERWHVFGGSWGSTLALAYAQMHPERCASLILRGICLLRQSELDWFVNGMRNIFPEAWRDFAALVPPDERHDLLGAYKRMFESKDEALRRKAALTYAHYEVVCSTLLQEQDAMPAAEAERHHIGMALLEAHYFTNNLFDPEDKLLRDIGLIRHIPAVIVQGRYDIVCPIVTADELHQAWPEAEYRIIPDAGHSALEPGIRSALVAAAEKFKHLPLS
jgi:proline iminopeptidase